MRRGFLGKALKGASKAMHGGADVAGSLVGKAVDAGNSTIRHAAEAGSELRNTATDEMYAISKLGSKKILDGVSDVKKKTADRGIRTTSGRQDAVTAGNEQPEATNFGAQDSMPISVPLDSRSADPDMAQDVDAQQESLKEPNRIDRQTAFAEGVLRLTAENLILYDADGRQEIRRIPTKIISSCSRGFSKNSLVVKTMTNIDPNFQKYLAKKKQELVKLPGAVSTLRSQERSGLAMMNARPRTNDIYATSAALGNNLTGSLTASVNGALAAQKESDLKTLPSYIEHMELDMPTIVATKREKADTEKESFHLPKNWTREQAKREYLIWEYLIERRKAGKNFSITTTPTNAVVLADGVVQGCSPLVVDLPLTEKAALARKCTISVLLEGHEHKTLSIKPGERYEYRKIEMKPRKSDDPVADQLIQNYRAAAPEHPIDISPYDIEYEVAGVHGILVTTRDKILVLTLDRKQCLYAIPYASVNDAQMMRGFIRGIKGLSVSYNDDNFVGQNLEFVIGRTESKNKTEKQFEHIVDAIMSRRGRACPLTKDYRPPRYPRRNLPQ